MTDGTVERILGLKKKSININLFEKDKRVWKCNVDYKNMKSFNK